MILLDTHALLWMGGEPRRLSAVARRAIQQAPGSGGLGIAAISLWEVAWLAARGRIVLATTTAAFLAELTQRTAIYPITSEIAALAASFGPDYPSDPCDRIIGATALAIGAPLITRDAALRRIPALQTVW